MFTQQVRCLHSRWLGQQGWGRANCRRSVEGQGRPDGWRAAVMGQHPGDLPRLTAPVSADLRGQTLGAQDKAAELAARWPWVWRGLQCRSWDSRASPRPQTVPRSRPVMPSGHREPPSRDAPSLTGHRLTLLSVCEDSAVASMGLCPVVGTGHTGSPPE